MKWIPDLRCYQVTLILFQVIDPGGWEGGRAKRPLPPKGSLRNQVSGTSSVSGLGSYTPPFGIWGAQNDQNPAQNVPVAHDF